LYYEFDEVVKSAFIDQSSRDNLIDWVSNIVNYKDSVLVEGAKTRFDEWAHGNLDDYNILWEACHILRNFLAHSIQLPECGFADRDWLFLMSNKIWQNFSSRFTYLVCQLLVLVSKYEKNQVTSNILKMPITSE